MEIKEAFGQALKQARLAKGLTQEDFSNVSSRTYISRLERAIFSPTLEKIDQLATHLGIHPLTLITLCYLRLENNKPLNELLILIENELNSRRAQI
jgi:transcriptional regulator with XRE-family HTH domain